MNSAGGIIYELRFLKNDCWYPFYVGRTEHQRKRLQAHRSSAKSGHTFVYQFIRETLTPNAIQWDLFPVESYDGDYVDQEDEHIMSLLVDNVPLTNMKKGDANWMAKRQAEANDMRQRGMTSYRKYRECLTLEQQERIAAEKHAKWLAEQEEKTKASHLKQVVAELQIKQNLIIEERRQQQEQKRLREIQRQTELEKSRAVQRDAWNAANAVRWAEEAEQLAIAQAEKEKQRLAREKQIKLIQEQKIQALDNSVNNIVTKLGLTPIVRNNTSGLGGLFEEE